MISPRRAAFWQSVSSIFLSNFRFFLKWIYLRWYSHAELSVSYYHNHNHWALAFALLAFEWAYQRPYMQCFLKLIEINVQPLSSLNTTGFSNVKNRSQCIPLYFCHGLYCLYCYISSWLRILVAILMGITLTYEPWSSKNNACTVQALNFTWIKAAFCAVSLLPTHSTDFNCCLLDVVAFVPPLQALLGFYIVSIFLL